MLLAIKFQIFQNRSNIVEFKIAISDFKPRYVAEEYVPKNELISLKTAYISPLALGGRGLRPQTSVCALAVC